VENNEQRVASYISLFTKHGYRNYGSVIGAAREIMQWENKYSTLSGKTAAKRQNAWGVIFKWIL